MSSDANCSFCSKIDDAIHVICEKRCLICAHCQRSSGIRQLLIGCLDRAVEASRGTLCDPQCPLCHHTMAPNMVTNIKRSRKEMATHTHITASEALLDTPNALRALLTQPASQGRKRELRSMRSGIHRQPSSLLNGRNGLTQKRLTMDAVSRNNQSVMESSRNLRPDDDVESLNSLDDLSVSSAEEDEVNKTSVDVSSRRVTRLGSSIGSAAGRRRQSALRGGTPSKQRQMVGSRGKGAENPEDNFESSLTPLASVQPLQLPPYTQQTALDLIVEVYVKMWNAYMNDNFEPLSSHLRETLARGRMSKHMVDAKVKNVIDFFSAIQPDTFHDPSLAGAHLHHNHNSHHPGKPLDSSPTFNIRHSLVSPISNHSGAATPAGKLSPPPMIGAYPTVNTHFYLFGTLLGLQPGSLVQSNVLPMQGHIAVIILVMAVCERCLRNNQLLTVSDDSLGVLQPTTAELSTKLCPLISGSRQPLTGKKLICIPLKKAISILKCLVQTDEYRFNMCALKSACVEYGVTLPWHSKSSLSALLHCFVSLSGDGQSLLLGNYSAQIQSTVTDSTLTSENAPPHGPPPTPSHSRIKRGISFVGGANAFVNNPNDGKSSGQRFPPVHLLGGAVKDIWDKKKKLNGITFESALSMCKSRGQLISLPYFIFICIETWKAELKYVLHSIHIQRQANLRRHGMKPHAAPFQKSSRLMKISHKKALKYIYDSFADKTISTFETRLSSFVDGLNSKADPSQTSSFASTRNSLSSSASQETLKDTLRTGIDWEEVRERAMKTETIGAIPYVNDVAAFLSKSNAELEHLARLVMLESCKRQEWQHLMDGCGWQDEWCWGGIGIKQNTEKDEEREDVPGDDSTVSTTSSHLAPNCSASVALRTFRKLENYRMSSPSEVEQSQWDVLSMRPAVKGDVVVSETSMSREKLASVLSRAGVRIGGLGLKSGVDAIMEVKDEDTFQEDIREDVDNESEINEIPCEDDEDVDQDVLAEHERLMEEAEHCHSDDHDDCSESKSRSEDTRATKELDLPKSRGRMSISRTPSMKDLIESDFHTYFKETNTRTERIKKNFNDTIPPPSSKFSVKQNHQNHFVICDSHGDREDNEQTIAAQLYLKQEPRSKKLASSTMRTPAPVAPHLEYRLSKADKGMSSWADSQWNSPHPVRHRVHLADIVSAKHSHGDIFVRTGLLQPLKPPSSSENENCDEENENEVEENDNEEGDGGGEEEEAANLRISASAPSLLSSLEKLEFSLPPEQLTQRLVDPPLGNDDELEENEAGGLIFRTMSPVGARNRCNVDLGHFSHMRPSEQPSMSAHATIESLNLSESLLSAAALANILNSLTKHKQVFKNLRKIDLSGNKIGDDGVQHLCDSLACGCPELVDVSIRGNHVTDAGAIELLQAILDGGGGKSVLKIDLGRNNLTLRSARVAELLTQFPRLRVLDLSWNTVTLLTFAEKASARSIIEKCRNLQVFSVSYNRMGDGGVALFLQSLENAPSMQMVDLAYCFCSEKVVKPLLSLLRQPLSNAGVSLLMLHGVALPLAVTEEIIASSAESGRKVILEGHHTGISINLKY